MGSVGRDCHGLWCWQSLLMGVLCRISSDLVCMAQRELRRGQHAVLVQTVHLQHAGVAKPNAKTLFQALYLSAGYGDFVNLSCRHHMYGGRV